MYLLTTWFNTRCIFGVVYCFIQILRDHCFHVFLILWLLILFMWFVGEYLSFTFRLELDNIEISPMPSSRRGGHYNLSPIDRNGLVKCDQLSSSKNPSAGFCIADMTRHTDLKSDSKDQRVTIVGTMQELEKPYLRLSKVSPPFY